MDQDTDYTDFAALAANLSQVDRSVYETYGKNPCLPIIGEGHPNARLAVFGRDPGRDEVRHNLPFIGAGGRKIREQLHRCLTGDKAPDFEACVQAGRFVWWGNTVPYKPIGNKAWSMAVKTAFFPLMARRLLTGWKGKDILTVGREAFFWFGISAEKTTRDMLRDFWAREDRFEASLEIRFSPKGLPPRQLTLHPLPHPSPLNAVWHKRFPHLLYQRLCALQFHTESWTIAEEVARSTL